MTTTVHTTAPEYVHDPLDTIIHKVPLNFHGHQVPLAVRTRLTHRAPRPYPVPAQPAPVAKSKPVPAQPAPVVQPTPVPAPPAPTAATVPEQTPATDDLPGQLQRVLEGMAAGLSNADIGAQMFISEGTVKIHARRLFRRLGARDRAHAVALGFRTGVLR